MAITKSTNDAVATKPNVTETAPAPVTAEFQPSKRIMEITQAEYKKQYKERDFDSEARGKVACVAFNAALASPGLAGLGYTNYDEYMSYVRKAADASVAYTWEHKK